MPKLFAQSRYLIMVPIIGLALAAAFFFVFGGVGLIIMIVNLVLNWIFGAEATHAGEQTPPVVEVIEHVHQSSCRTPCADTMRVG